MLYNLAAAFITVSGTNKRYVRSHPAPSYPSSLNSLTDTAMIQDISYVDTMAHDLYFVLFFLLYKISFGDNYI